MMLTLGYAETGTYRNSQYYSCNFSVSLKVIWKLTIGWSCIPLGAEVGELRATSFQRLWRQESAQFSRESFYIQKPLGNSGENKYFLLSDIIEGLVVQRQETSLLAVDLGQAIHIVSLSIK